VSLFRFTDLEIATKPLEEQNVLLSNGKIKLHQRKKESITHSHNIPVILTPSSVAIVGNMKQKN
jgi:hypothetical protein